MIRTSGGGAVHPSMSVMSPAMGIPVRQAASTSIAHSDAVISVSLWDAALADM